MFQACGIAEGFAAEHLGETRQPAVQVIMLHHDSTSGKPTLHDYFDYNLLFWF